MALMLNNEFIVLVVDGDGSEALHGALPEQQRSLLALHNGGIHIVQDSIANLEKHKSAHNAPLSFQHLLFFFSIIFLNFGFVVNCNQMVAHCGVRGKGHPVAGFVHHSSFRFNCLNPLLGTQPCRNGRIRLYHMSIKKPSRIGWL